MRNRQHAPGPSLSLAILTLLDERPMHPYEMQQEVRHRALDQVIKVRVGSLYHTVERLQQAGLIQPQETEREGRRPERTVYAITEAGRDEMGSVLRRLLSEPAPEYPQFGAALAFLRHLPCDEVPALLRRRVVGLEADLAAAGSIMRNLEKNGLPRLSIIELEHAQALRRAELEWTRGLIEDVDTGRLGWTPGGERNQDRNPLQLKSKEEGP
jgi:DNA-binding PadR family transcriptional regulator